MSAATPAERSRAARLRKKLRATGDLSPADRAWLEAYDGPKRVNLPPPASAAPAEPEVNIEQLFAARPSPELHRPDDFDEAGDVDEAGDADEADDETFCNVGPDCPECNKARRGGARRCEATGRMAWPPMTEKQALAAASFGLGITGAVTRGVRRWLRGEFASYVAPTPEEKEDLADALDTIQRMHAGWLAWGSEWLQLGQALGGYARRSYTAPALPRPGTAQTDNTERSKVVQLRTKDGDT